MFKIWVSKLCRIFGMTAIKSKQIDSVERLRKRLGATSNHKSGLEHVDFKKVNEVIYKASHGSKYFENQKAMDNKLQHRVEELKRKISEIDHDEDARIKSLIDTKLKMKEQTRDTSQTIVHCDCDAFFASVEELDRPELKNIPFGVGSSILCTANYLARKDGVRSAMPTYIARQLSPSITVVPLHFDKYKEKAQEIRDVLKDYDPNFKSASIDEAFLNITKYLESAGQSAEQVVQEMRAKVHLKTGITVSCGIAANTQLAKICSNMNKPNGQFMLVNSTEAIRKFMETLPVRKVYGIGKVSEAIFESIGINTCSDIYENRVQLYSIFSKKKLDFLLDVYLGLGCTDLKQYMSALRKSIGTERTFSKKKKSDEIVDILKSIAEELAIDCVKNGNLSGKTLVLKYKLDTFQVYTRQKQLPMHISSSQDIFRHSLELLEKEMPLSIRLLGIRLTNLYHNDCEPRITDLYKFLDGEQASENEIESPISSHSLKVNEHTKISCNTWTCPSCSREITADLGNFNAHVDFCLSRSLILELSGFKSKDNQELSSNKNYETSSKKNQVIDSYLKL